MIKSMKLELKPIIFISMEDFHMQAKPPLTFDLPSFMQLTVTVF